MPPKSDAQLLGEYAEHGAESAIAEIIARYTNLVYSAALRQVDSPDMAAEVAQSVFIGLARGARDLSRKLAENASLAGWLCRSARNRALNLRRDEFRRQSRERQAMQNLDSLPDAAPDWERLRPVLDEAMSGLSEPDYDALVLRFFQNQDLRSVGLALGLSDDAAQKRVARALDKLRGLLAQRGFTSSATVLSTALAANAVQLAPAGLTATLSTAALAGTTLTTAATATATKAIAMTTLQKTLIAATLVAAVGTGIYEARQAATLRTEIQTLQQREAPLAEQIQQLQQDRVNATRQLAALREDNARLNSNTADLLRLRGEVARLAKGARAENDPAVQLVREWKEKEAKLRRLFEEKPDQRIPEMRLLDDVQWMDVAKSADLESAGGIRIAFGHVRHTAKMAFGMRMMIALQAYMKANNKRTPDNILQLVSYFRPAIDDADVILSRYEMLRKGASTNPRLIGLFIAEKDVIDKAFDRAMLVGPDGLDFDVPIGSKPIGQ